jgi:hypothetical protein
LQFLCLPNEELALPDDRSPRYAPLPAQLRRRLAEFYAPHNDRLYALLGEDLGW